MKMLPQAPLKDVVNWNFFVPLKTFSQAFYRQNITK